MGEPQPLRELVPGVVAELLEREGRSAESSVTQGESGTNRGRMGAQQKTAPAVRQHCGSGASPTVKESTDG